MACLRMTIKIRPADFTSDFQSLKLIRERVFVQEQAVPLEMEWDEYDQHAYHLLAFADDQAVATARLLANGKIGRMAVLPEWRHQGIGSLLLLHLIDKARQDGHTQVVLSAQVAAIPFYERLGFIVTSDTYEDAGIPHRDMQLRLVPSK